MSKKNEAKSYPRAVTYKDKQGPNSWEHLKKRRGVRVIDTVRVRARR